MKKKKKLSSGSDALTAENKAVPVTEQVPSDAVSEILIEVREAEKEADSIIKRATEEARGMVLRAEEDADRLRKETVLRVKEDRRKVAETATLEGNEEANKIIEAAKCEAAKLSDSVDMTEAVDFIKKKVLAGYGCC